MAKVKAAAREAGLSEDIAEPVWRTPDRTLLAHEFGVWDTIREQA